MDGNIHIILSFHILVENLNGSERQGQNPNVVNVGRVISLAKLILFTISSQAHIIIQSRHG